MIGLMVVSAMCVSGELPGGCRIFSSPWQADAWLRSD